LHVFQPIKNGEFITAVTSAVSIAFASPWGAVTSASATGTTHELILTLKIQGFERIANV